MPLLLSLPSVYVYSSVSLFKSQHSLPCLIPVSPTAKPQNLLEFGMVFSATVRPVGIIENSRLRQDLSGSSHHSNLSTSSASSQMLSRVMSRTPHVCIVGAGVAGLRCADVLLQHGMRVTILEGRNRIGGRVSLTVLSVFFPFRVAHLL